MGTQGARELGKMRATPNAYLPRPGRAVQQHPSRRCHFEPREYLRVQQGKEHHFLQAVHVVRQPPDLGEGQGGVHL